METHVLQLTELLVSKVELHLSLQIPCKVNWLQLAGQAKQHTCLTFVKSSPLGQHPLHYPSRKSKDGLNGKKTIPETCLSIATPFHRPKELSNDNSVYVILYIIWVYGRGSLSDSNGSFLCTISSLLFDFQAAGPILTRISNLISLNKSS